MIEKHLGTMRNLRTNLDTFNLGPICRLKQADAFYMASHPAELDVTPSVPWLVFCSPPYDFYVSKQAEMLDMLRNLYEHSPQDSIFVIESDHRFDFELLQLTEENNLRRRSYAPAEIGIYKK